jgi:Fe-S oxidoreductase
VNAPLCCVDSKKKRPPEAEAGGRSNTGNQPLSEDLRNQAQALRQNCSDCKACVTQCAFLQKNGTPGEIAASLLAGQTPVDPFLCSLCNLCTAVCPNDIAPGAFFLELRRQAAARANFPTKTYATILSYERRGSSSLFSWHGLPTGCDTVFFPGCTLPGSRPDTTWGLFQQLKAMTPHLGVVLDCCHKPSHDLGRHQFFLDRFSAMRGWLISRGIRRIIVACPNCFKVFQEYGQGLIVQTAWELLAERPATPLTPATPATSQDRITIHDPCPLRDHQEVHQAVRGLITGLGLEIREMRHSRNRTICCGEGGSVGFINPDLAQQWGEMRKHEAGDDLIITYCAGCAGFLARAGMKVVHLGDLVVNQGMALNGKSSGARAPWTYLNRIKLKRKLNKALQGKKGTQKKFQIP